MGVLWSFAGAALGLALLDAAVTSPASGNTTVAAGNLSGGLKVLGTFVSIVVDPTRPAIADHSQNSSSAMPAPTKPTIPTGGAPSTNPLQAPPPGSKAPPRDYNPGQGGVIKAF